MPDSSAFDTECFFVAPIGEEGSDVRKRSDGVLSFIVSRAADELGLVAVRADRIASPGQINLQVIEHVLSAKVVVADLTGLNANVFYEMAVRHTAKLPVVLIAERDTVLPFDIAQMRTIFFRHTDLADADSCRVAIVDQLREALSSGTVDSPISTALDIASLASGNAADRSVAELVTTVEELARSQRETRELLELSLSRRRERSPIPDPVMEDLLAAYNTLAALVGDEPESDVYEAFQSLGRPIRFLRGQSEAFRGLAPRASPPAAASSSWREPRS